MNEALISHDGPGHRWLASLGHRGMELGLQRITALLDRLGRPHDAYPCIVVAGSDGKGSTSAMIGALLHEAGLRVGHFTSPHLVETRERVWWHGRCVTAADLDRALEQARNHGIDLDVTPFEALTAAALWLFAQAGTDVVVLEVGLGGRLDATNATDPVVSVVTHLSHDHMAVLGPRLSDIAWEKCGVARRGRPLVVANEGLCATALRKHGIDARLVGLGTAAVAAPSVAAGTNWRALGRIAGPGLPLALDVELALPGRHQLDNAALALLAVHEFARAAASRLSKPLPPLEDLVPALAATDWPCRAEMAETEPVPLLIDAAHNPAGMFALAGLLSERGKGWQLLIALRKDREPDEILRAAATVAQTLWLVRCQGETLWPVNELAARLDRTVPMAAYAVGSIEKCLPQAKLEAGRQGGVVLTGSQHALGEWLKSGAVRSPALDRRLAT
jgi:dihydrofolate synthase/folylpolyglutamate synthase